MPLDNGVLNAPPPDALAGILSAPPAAPMPSILGPAVGPTPDPTSMAAQQSILTAGAPPPAQAGPGGGLMGALAAGPGGLFTEIGSNIQARIAANAAVQQQRQLALAAMGQHLATIQRMADAYDQAGDKKNRDLLLADPDGFIKTRIGNLAFQDIKAGDTAGNSEGPGWTAPLMSVTKDGVGITQTPTATTMTGSVPTIQTVTGAQRVGPLAPLGPAAGVPGQPGGPAPLGSPTMSVGGDPVPPPPAPPGNTGPIQPSWGLAALHPAARAVAGQILAHPAIASMDPQDQANILGIAYSESRFRAGAQNGSSTSLFQFQPPTFAHYNPGGNINATPDQIAAEAAMYSDDKAQLSAPTGLGAAPTPGQMYLAAMQGPQGALALLKAAPGTNAVTALRGIGVSSQKALASIAGNIPGVAYSTPTERQQANSLAMKMTAQQFAQTWDTHFNMNMHTMFGGSHVDGMPAAPAAQAEAQPGPPAANGSPYPTTMQGPTGDRILTADQVPNGQPNFTYKQAPDGSLTPIPPAVTESDFNGLGNQYVNGDIHKRAGQIVGDLSTLATSLATLPPGALQSQQAVNAALSSMTRANTIRPVTIEKFEESQGMGEAANALISRTFGDKGQTITAPMLQQMYRMTHIAAKQANDQDAATLAPILATAQRFGYDASNYTGQHPKLPTVPPAMQDVIPPPAQRKVGATYWGPNGPGVWTGKPGKPWTWQ